MDRQKSAVKPMLYIIQPDFPRGAMQMQDHFIWRKKKQKKVLEDDAAPIAEAEAIKNDTEVVLDKGEATDQQTSVISEVPVPEEELLLETEDNLHKQDDLQKVDVQQLVESGLRVESKDSKAIQPKAVLSLAADHQVHDPIFAKNEDNAVNKEEKREKRTAKPAMVEHFLNSMKEKNIQHVETLVAVPEVEADKPIKPTRGINDEHAMEIRRTVSRLARYPHFLERPLVKAVVAGESMQFQIDRKRGNELRIKIGERFKVIRIEEITEIEVL